MKAAILSLLLTTSAFGATGFPEPNVIFYGTATNTNGGAQAYIGELVWTVAPPLGAPFNIVGALENLADGAFSYRIEIPAEKVPSTFQTTPSNIDATPAAEIYDLSATIDGNLVTLLVGGTNTPHDANLSYQEISRGVIERIDLAFTGTDPETIDTDEDGMPDFWEDQYGLNKNDPTDAFNDEEGDFVINLLEYYEDSDPTCYEWTRWVATTGLNSLSAALKAPEADPDLDGIANLVEYALGSDPRTPDSHLAESKVSLDAENDGGQDYLVMTVNRPIGRECHADYFVEISTDLVDWNSQEGVDIETILSDLTMLKVRNPQFLGAPASGRSFMRLSIHFQP